MMLLPKTWGNKRIQLAALPGGEPGLHAALWDGEGGLEAASSFLKL